MNSTILAFQLQKITKGTVALLASQFVVQGSAIFLGILIARAFGGTVYGQYSLAFAFVGMFGMLFTMGADAIVVREVARSPKLAGSLLGSALWLRLISFPLALVIIYLISQAAGYAPYERQLILMASISVGLSAAGDLPRAVFQGLQRMELDTLSRGMEKMVAVVLAWFFLARFQRIETVMFAIIIASAIGLCFSWAILLRLLYLVWRPILSLLRYSAHLLEQAVPLGGSMVIITFYTRLPFVILSLFRSYHEVGLYSAAYNLTSPFTLLPVALVGALLPVLCDLFQSSRQSLNQLHHWLLVACLAMGLPLGAGLGLLAGDVLQVLYGEPFREATEALRILSLTIPLIFLTTYLSNILIASGAQRLLLAVTISNLGMALGANVLFIPLLGFLGAAIGVVLTETAGLALLFYFTSRYVRHRLHQRLVAIIVATVLMVVGLLLLHVTLWVRIPLAASFYLLGLWATGGITLREFAFGIHAILSQHKEVTGG